MCFCALSIKEISSKPQRAGAVEPSVFPREHVHNEEMKERHKITKGNLMNYTAK